MATNRSRVAAEEDSSSVKAVALFAIVSLVRVLVGYQPHSGQDNYHGATTNAAYGGDFEAQRHWMELTWQLDVSQWYWYDLDYWGLDYPPLTAYLSWVCGGLSALLVGPDSVALVESRGLEDPVHKSFMRGTVLITDILFFGTAVWCLTTTMKTTMTKERNVKLQDNEQHYLLLSSSSSAWHFLLAMIQPAILLIDHGHFQYNTVALGLSLWAFFFMSFGDRSRSLFGCIVGSILFCMALSFKQMTLYYAPAVFFYLLGRCFALGNLKKAAAGVAYLGITVIASFVLMWWPFIVYGPEFASHTERAVQVLRRIFPLQRGLFEGKVSNLWCALSVKPFRLRQRLPEDVQPIAALILTLLLAAPCCYALFRAGKATHGNVRTHRLRDQQRMLLLLWGTTSSALAFFLASFQVHEKSLLLALAPCSMLWNVDETFVNWFSIVTAWTLWPLMQIDRLQTAYVCTILIFVSILRLRRELIGGINYDERYQTNGGFFEQNSVFQWIPSLSYALMIILHVAEMVVVPPDHLPDLFPVLWSIVGCGFCCLAWLITCWHLRRQATVTISTTRKQKVS